MDSSCRSTLPLSLDAESPSWLLSASDADGEAAAPLPSNEKHTILPGLLILSHGALSQAQ